MLINTHLKLIIYFYLTLKFYSRTVWLKTLQMYKQKTMINNVKAKIYMGYDAKIEMQTNMFNYRNI